MFVHIVAALAIYYSLCVLYHRYVRHTGQVVRFYKSLLAAPLLGDAATSGIGSSGVGGGASLRGGGPGAGGPLNGSGVEEVVGFYGFAGDLGTALVAEEVLVDRVYFRNGITLRDSSRSLHSSAPLVVDVGAHIGLFTLAVLRECADAVVVGAEPVPQLHALAERNTSREAVGDSGEVFIEQMAIGRANETTVDLTVDPFITAGSSAYLAEITRPLREHAYANGFALARAIGLDNVRAGNFPYFPTAALCHALRVPVLRVLVVALASPVLLLLYLFYTAGPHNKTTVRCHQGQLAELLERAATRAAQQEDGHALSRRIRDADRPIDLVKIDVEGGEMGVLEGIADAEWRRIRQLVVEVHDIDDRVLAVRRLLSSKGFNHVVVDEEDWASHELLRIRCVYAKKISTPAGASLL